MSGWCSFSHASTTGANASLISTRSIWSSVIFARSSTLVVAGIGPVSISTGSTPASANVWKRARGLRPSSFAFSSLMTSTAAAPSVICDEFAAVITPSSLNAGFSVGELLDRRVGTDALVAGERSRSPSSVVTSTGRISRSKRPSSVARAARLCDSHRERVVGLARDAPLLGDELGRDALRNEVGVAARHHRAEREAVLAVGDRRAHRHAASCSRCPPRSRRRTRRRSRPARRSARPAATNRTGGRPSCRPSTRGSRRRARRCGRR